MRRRHYIKCSGVSFSSPMLEEDYEIMSDLYNETMNILHDDERIFPIGLMEHFMRETMLANAREDIQALQRLNEQVKRYIQDAEHERQITNELRHSNISTLPNATIQNNHHHDENLQIAEPYIPNVAMPVIGTEGTIGVNVNPEDFILEEVFPTGGAGLMRHIFKKYSRSHRL